ncbi:hypothetical protein C2G38_2096880 [Gigaspora rosea]|uniref:Uncharacterized protein n=1 Tax=Gigaspora rosea TaxID=44941 RepID=A0A397V424_9GLOM|nr:hypothetical protein C2G38_2096880 [Gigaspora rosea]
MCQSRYCTTIKSFKVRNSCNSMVARELCIVIASYLIPYIQYICTYSYKNQSAIYLIRNLYLRYGPLFYRNYLWPTIKSGRTYAYTKNASLISQ